MAPRRRKTAPNNVHGSSGSQLRPLSLMRRLTKTTHYEIVAKQTYSQITSINNLYSTDNGLIKGRALMCLCIRG